VKSSIALIGFMGTGKTVVGKLLAEKLGKEFLELDEIIIKMAGKPIPAIFQEQGEITFRELEIEAVRRVSEKKNAVLSCGGGIVLNKINIDRLKQEHVIIHLTAKPGEILKRIEGDINERPLLSMPDKARQIRELMEFRRPYYERAADIVINTSGLKPEKVADVIVKRLKEYESHHQ
jgi:shikimate kinase